MMKKVLLIPLMCLALISCKSKEDKALELINNDMFKSLYDYKSYEPIETSLDSAFSSAYTDSTIRNFAIKCEATFQLANEAFKAGQSARKYADIYAGSYFESGRQKYIDYLNEATQEFKASQTYQNQCDANLDSIKHYVSSFKPEFIGWQVKHKFRCNSKGGHASIGNYVYIITPDCKKIIYKEDMDDDASKSIRKWITIAANPSKSE